MFSTKFLLAVIAASQVVFAAPAEENNLAKRGEGIHLMNCTPWGGEGSDGRLTSIVAVSNMRIAT
jgi:hypothetical protein